MICYYKLNNATQPAGALLYTTRGRTYKLMATTNNNNNNNNNGAGAWLDYTTTRNGATATGATYNAKLGRLTLHRDTLDTLGATADRRHVKLQHNPTTGALRLTLDDDGRALHPTQRFINYRAGATTPTAKHYTLKPDGAGAILTPDTANN